MLKILKVKLIFSKALNKQDPKLNVLKVRIKNCCHLKNMRAIGQIKSHLEWGVQAETQLAIIQGVTLDLCPIAIGKMIRNHVQNQRIKS